MKLRLVLVRDGEGLDVESPSLEPSEIEAWVASKYQGWEVRHTYLGTAPMSLIQRDDLASLPSFSEWIETGSDLKACPFCGEFPELKKTTIDIGAGDIQSLFYIICDCPVGPAVRVRGEAGYKVNTERSNEEAKALARSRWNTRA